MHLLIAREAVDRHLEVAGEILEGDGRPQGEGARRAPGGPLLREVAAAARGRRGPEAAAPTSEYGELAGHLRFVERSSRKLARSTFYAMGRWQAKLEKRQAVLGRIVDIGAELFAMSSAVVYATTIRAERPSAPPRPPSWPTCSASRRGAASATLFRALWSNEDVENYALAQRVLEGRYAFLEEGIADPAGRRAGDRRPSARSRAAARRAATIRASPRARPGPSRRAAPRRAARACRASARRPPR